MPKKIPAHPITKGTRPSLKDQLDAGAGEKKEFVLKLYVSGMMFRSTAAIKNVQWICNEYLFDRCDLEIIDIAKNPSQAREAQVIAAPTLVKTLPLPVRRMIGDMSNTEKVLSGLGIDNGA